MSIFRSSREPDPEPVKVAFANNATEAAVVQGILKEEGIPSITRKPNGTFLTDLFGIGAREILVPAAAETHAARVLADYESASEDDLPGA